jgi:hypothetical protein
VAPKLALHSVRNLAAAAIRLAKSSGSGLILQSRARRRGSRKGAPDVGSRWRDIPPRGVLCRTDRRPDVRLMPYAGGCRVILSSDVS